MQLSVVFQERSLFPLLKVLRLSASMGLLALQQNNDVYDKAITFEKFFLDAENGRLPKTDDYGTKLPSFVDME